MKAHLAALANLRGLARLVPERDGLRIERLIDGGGAQAAGIAVGDRIVSVDGAPVADLGLEGAVARIRGIAGTTVTLGVQRGTATTTYEVVRRRLKA